MQNPLGRLWSWAYDRPLLLATITMICWAGNFVAARGVYQDVPPVTLAMFRWGGAFLVLLPFAWPHLKKDMAAIRRHWRPMLAFAFFGITCFNTLAYTGLQYTVAMNAMLFQSSMPIIIAILTFMLFRERPTLFQVLGVAVSLFGVCYVVVRGDLDVLLALSLNKGDIWILIAFVTWGIYTVLLRYKPGIHWLSFLAATFLAGFVILSPFWVAELASGRDIVWSWRAGGAIFYVALFPSVIAYACYNRAIELAGGNRIAPLFHLVPVIGSFMAVAILGEQLRFYHIFGFAVVMSGIALTNRRRDRRAASSQG
ncbi:MAG: DMT family transporter [Rhodobiaceae bacterium]|nr:DMT family transporter [Rhodobiaceae bacterium]